MKLSLIRRVARNLKYRPLPHLFERSVLVSELSMLEEAVRSDLGADFPNGCSLEPDHNRELAIAKYGILDLTFAAPSELLPASAEGVSLLRDLGFLHRYPPEELPTGISKDDPFCLGFLDEEIAKGETLLRLFLEGGRPEPLSLKLPAGHLPRPFQVTDACVTNAGCVWLWKHFYL